jgi:hypothetical protein
MRTSSIWSNTHSSVAEIGLLQKVEWAFCPMRRGLSLRSPPRTGCRAPGRYATVSITPCSASASQRRAECPPLPCRQSLALVTASLCLARFGFTASVADMLDISAALADSKKGATACNSISRAVTDRSPRSTSCSKTRTTSSEPAQWTARTVEEHKYFRSFCR